ncbi:MAG: ABC transporter permease [Methanomassiliicoccaceae archaeon]|nr:ABC transporter permease [Methanomassiliicoccaceae archaeon]
MTKIVSRLKELYDYRYMILSLVRRDLRGKYKNSVLGVFWNFLNPLFQIIIYIIVFTAILYRDIDAYYVYLIVGIMPWFFFSGSLSEGSGSIVSHSNMVKKIYFPREALVMSVVLSRFITLLIAYAVVIFIIFVTGFGFTWFAFALLPLIFAVQFMFTLGLTLFFAAVNVYYRDVSHALGVLLMGWMWLTPIVYMRDIGSDILQTIMSLNPVTYFIGAYHDLFYYKVIPNIGSLGICFALAFVSLAVGWMMFMRLERRFAEEL